MLSVLPAGRELGAHLVSHPLVDRCRSPGLQRPAGPCRDVRASDQQYALKRDTSADRHGPDSQQLHLSDRRRAQTTPLHRPTFRSARHGRPALLRNRRDRVGQLIRCKARLGSFRTPAGTATCHCDWDGSPSPTLQNFLSLASRAPANRIQYVLDTTAHQADLRPDALTQTPLRWRSSCSCQGQITT